MHARILGRLARPGPTQGKLGVDSKLKLAHSGLSFPRPTLLITASPLTHPLNLNPHQSPFPSFSPLYLFSNFVDSHY
ncbi:hypothetical protein RIF29_10805 [Crotalaria pallida]|uniref:Uncharacterized protein n=1 Tax=Crotalaria pallida TaxID=3830 RepID=A0AAN9FT35_CROPI